MFHGSMGIYTFFIDATMIVPIQTYPSETKYSSYTWKHASFLVAMIGMN